MQLKIPAHTCDRYRVRWKWSTQQLVEDWMSRGHTNTYMARWFPDLYHVFAWKQCILCPALHHGCYTLIYVTSIFFAPGTIAHGFFRPPHSLAFSRGCSLAINSTWQQHHNRFSFKSNFSPYQHFLWKCFHYRYFGCLSSAVRSFTKLYTRNFKISLNFYKKVYTFCMNWRQDLMQTNLLLFGCFWKVVITHLFFKSPLYTLQMAKCK